MRTAGIIVIGFLLASANPAMGPEQKKTRLDSTDIAQALPSHVLMMFRWPDAATMNGEKRVDPGAIIVAYPKKRSYEWIHAVLDAPWLPPATAEMVFLRREFADLDVTRIQWDRSDYHVEVSQTATILAIKLTPLGDRDTGRDRDGRYDHARRLCLEIFKNEVRMWVTEPGRFGETVVVPDLKRKIASYSFDVKNVRELPADKVVVGFAKTLKDEGIEGGSGRLKEEGVPAFAEMTGTEHAWAYWFRDIHWWNDGKAVGFYILKVEGQGSWMANWGASAGVNWFDVSRDRLGRPLSTQSSQP